MPLKGARQRTTLTMQEKKEVIRKLENGATVEDITLEYGICQRTVRSIRNIPKVFLAQQQREALHRKRNRKPMSEELDSRLYLWFIERKLLGYPITDVILQKEAMRMSAKMNTGTFKASKGWLWRFKKRHDIKLSGLQNAGPAEVESMFRHLAQRVEKSDIDWRDIYNMDETRLMWKALPRRTLFLEGEGEEEGCTAKRDSVTLAFCVNATGCHKLTPLLVYKVEHQRAVKESGDLPVILRSEKNCHVDAEIFRDWFRNHFKPAVAERQRKAGRSGKVLLLIDNCKAHKLCGEIQEDNFEVIFLPDAADVHPVGQGVVEKVKRSFRYRLLRRVLAVGSISEFYADYSIKECVDMLHEAWMEVTQQDICNAWRKLLGGSFIPEIGRDIVEAESCSDIDDVYEAIGELTERNVASDAVAEWMSECATAENFAKNMDNDVKENVEDMDDKDLEENANDIENSKDCRQSTKV